MKKERAQRSRRWKIERQSRSRTSLKKKGGARSRRWEMERQLGRRTSLKRTRGPEEPGIGGPEPLKSESSEKSSEEADEKRVDSHAGYAGRVP
jgi:hypothetical protein